MTSSSLPVPVDDETLTTTSAWWTDPARRPFLAALIMWAGCASAAAFSPTPTSVAPAWYTLALGILFLLLTFFSWRSARPASRPFRAGFLALACAAFSLSASFTLTRSLSLSTDPLAQLASTDSALLRVTGTIRSTPILRTPSAPVHAYGQQAATTFELSVDSWEGPASTVVTPRPSPGLFVRMAGAQPGLVAGERVTLSGLLQPISPPLNPGEFDRATDARRRGLSASLWVADPAGLVRWPPDSSPPLLTRLQTFRERLHNRAAAWLFTGLDRTDPLDWLGDEVDRANRSRALLAALLLGDRSSQLSALTPAFQRTGLVHLLTISGSHLAIFIALLAFLLRLLHISPSLERGFILLLVLSYLLILPVEAPLLRSGLMVALYALFSAGGRRVEPLSILGLTAILLLLWNPSEAVTASFQLTFGIIIGLVTLTHPVRRLLFGPRPDLETLSRPRQVLHMLYTAVAASCAAFLWAAPLTLFHFGLLSTLSIPLSILLAPLVTLLLALGYLKVLLTALFPPLASLLGPPLLALADSFIWSIERADQLPFVSIRTLFPSLLWLLLCLSFLLYLASRPPRNSLDDPHPLSRTLLLRVLPIVLLCLYLFRGNLPFLSPLERDPSTRITMLAVGDGSCYLIESAGRAALFDCGSGSNPAAARTIITPALHRLGVLHLDSIIISHADVDHYNAARDVMTTFHCSALYITSPMRAESDRLRGSALATLVDSARLAGVNLITADAGLSLAFGSCTFDWLAPPPDPTRWLDATGSPLADNELAAVIRLSAPPSFTMLFTADSQAEGLRRLLNLPASQLRANAMELPHHGSWNPDSARLVSLVNPRFLFQSTGPSRLVLDRWTSLPASSTRFISQLDGAATLTITPDGAVTASTFRTR